MTRLLTEGRVVRRRSATVKGKARWVVHRDGCVYADGCVPLSALVDKVTERGVIARVRAGLVARCVSCHPTLIDRTEDTP